MTEKITPLVVLEGEERFLKEEEIGDEKILIRSFTKIY